ncbi:MAG: peptide deformylase, partial [Myxococcales bacterium]|nr:peptide deformylase [Myxococcales bacterium]
MSEKTHENAGADARDQAAPRPAVRLGDEQVLQLGDPRLRVVAAPCEPRDLPEDAARLIDALRRFRAQFGFGRAIAAPQLGIPRRLVALELGDGPFVIVDPVITWRSPETFTLWDDCMSFPELLVRVRRHAAV